MALPVHLVPSLALPADVVPILQRMNPWWQGLPTRPLPSTRRHLVQQVHARIKRRLAPITVVRGPRQIGKTTSQMQVISDLLAEGLDPRLIFRVQSDELEALTKLAQPILDLVDWYEQAFLGETANQVAARGQRVHLFLDEVQNLRGWDTQLKHLVDHSEMTVVVTGSSALRIERGRDSLAGRIHTLEAGVLSLTEIAAFRGINLGGPRLADNGLEPLQRPAFWQSLAADPADTSGPFAAFSMRGGYPLVHQKDDLPWHEVAQQLNENVIKRVIQHDLRVGDRGRKRNAQLLEELFRLACRYVGQSPGPSLLGRELKRVLGAESDIGVQRVRSYLNFLDETLLIRQIRPAELRLKKTRGHPTLCLADHGLRAAWLQEVVPIDPAGLEANPHLQDLAGHIAESVVGTLFASIYGLDVAHLPERSDQPEIDFLLTIGTQRIPVEVKHQRRIDPQRHTEGLRTFLEKAVHNAPFGLLVTQAPIEQPIDPRIIVVPLPKLLLLR